MYTDATHLIGPESCLCTACFRAIEKRSSSNYLQKDACIVITCKRSANRAYKSPLIQQVKILLAKKGVYKIFYSLAIFNYYPWFYLFSNY